MKTPTNKLILARKVIKSRIKKDEEHFVSVIIYNELQNISSRVLDNISSLYNKCETLTNGIRNKVCEVAAGDSVIAELRRRLSDLNRNVKEYCELAEAFHTATVADKGEEGANV